MCSQTERQLLTMSEFKEHTTLQMDSQSDGSRYFAPGVTKSTIHPLLASLMALSHREIAELYSRSYPNTDVNKLSTLLSTPTKMFRWSGVDVVPVLDNHGQKRMTVLEVNSCPAGQKYFPPKDSSADPSNAGYGELLKAAFIPNIPDTKGDLALLWDKNLMEVTGYAMALSKLMGEKVHVIPCRKDDVDPAYRFVGADKKLEVRVHGLKGDEWVPVRAAMKYVTCSPWQRIPPTPSTFILNCPASCLAGGRNKALGGIAFEKFNSEHRSDNIFLNSPRTAIVELSDVAETVRSLGCCAVVKVPYSNAGKGVFTIVNETELRDVMKKLKEFPTKKFVIQELISSPYWEQTTTPQYRFRPTKAGYAFDIRVMVASDTQGAKLIGMFARKCRTPLGNQRSSPSGDYLKTNLTVPLGSSSYGLDVSRCVLFDTIGFDELSLTLSDLAEAYVQSFLAMLSVDYLTQYICPQGKWNLERFSYLNYDPPLFKEINETNNDHNELPTFHTEILGCGTRLWESNLPGYSLLYQDLETEFQIRRESSLGIVQ